MRRSSLWVLALTISALGAASTIPALGLSGCSKATAEPIPEKIAIFFSNETENELYKCGCHANQQGGLSRRATVLVQQEAYPELLVDVGQFSARRPENPYDVFKQDYLLRIYNMLGYAALNVGPPEFRLGATKLKELNDKAGGTIISANVTNQAGELVLPAYRVVKVKGLRVGIIGLITEQFNPTGVVDADALKTTDPAEALGAIWDQVKAESDIQILLSQLRDDEIDLITQAYPDLDAILGGPGWRGATEMAPVDKNGIPYAKVGNRGKYIGQLDLTIDATDRAAIKVSANEGKVIALGDDIPNNTEVEKVLDEFKERLRTGDGPAQDQYDPHTEGAQYRYAGSQNCQTCHGAIYAGYLRTRHAQAFQTLSAKGEQNNPGCLECHTVGYQEPGGYGSPQKGNSYMVANVQCESCHGPAADHADLATKWEEGKIAEKPTDWKIERVAVAQETCIQCHDPENDPHWVNGQWAYESQLAQVTCSQWTAGAAEAGAAAEAAPITPAAPSTPPAAPADPAAPPPAAGH